MPMDNHIRNPVEWGWDQLKQARTAVSSTGRALRATPSAGPTAIPAVNHIGVSDLKDALRRGLDDFGECRTDVIFLCLVYPVFGLFLVYLTFGYGMLPLVFPLASGFALIGPALAVGLYEMSRRREQGHEVNWGDAFRVVASPSFGRIVMLGLTLLAIFLLWLVLALGLYMVTLGPEPPASVGSFVREVLTTPSGWLMTAVGIGAGFFFAVLVLTISVMSFPMLLDRDVRLGTAVATSIRAVVANPGTMALWGLIVATLLVVGSIPLFLGYIVVLPVLGHATWHLYRKVVPR